MYTESKRAYIVFFVIRLATECPYERFLDLLTKTTPWVYDVGTPFVGQNALDSDSNYSSLPSSSGTCTKHRRSGEVIEKTLQKVQNIESMMREQLMSLNVV